MRFSLLTLLLLTTAPIGAPAFAQSQPDQAEATETAEPRYEPTPRRQRQQREAPSPRSPERVTQPAERVEPVAPAPIRVREIARASSEPRGEERSRAPADAQDRADSWRGRVTGERRGRSRDLPPSDSSPVFGSTIQTPVTVTEPGREQSAGSALPTGRQGGGDLRGRIAAEGLRRDRIANDNWRREWRQDRRYDWRRYRDRDRSRFRLGFYIDPFGWGYRDWDLGWRLPSLYYSSRYWFNDPWYYRLPPVYSPYRWIRYHGDVLLVDLRTGRVVDRIRDFFW